MSNTRVAHAGETSRPFIVFKGKRYEPLATSQGERLPVQQGRPGSSPGVEPVNSSTP